MTANLNTPSIISGPLTAADLDRMTNAGRIYHLHRATLAPAGLDDQGRRETRQWPGTDQPMAAEAATDVDAGEREFSRMAPLVNVVFIVVLFSALSALALKPPGTAPPVSGQWPVFDSQQKMRPSRQTGMAKRTSIRWVPPR